MQLNRIRNARLVALAATALAIAWGTPGPAGAVGVGQPAPAFHAPDLDGGEPLALDAYRGKVVFLDFWASWCPPCLNSLPQLDSLRKEFPSSEFQVLAVNLDRDPDKALRFLAKRPVGYPSASDPEGRIPARYEVGTMPTSFLIDRRGVVRYVHEGFRSGDVERLRDEIRKLVDGKE